MRTAAVASNGRCWWWYGAEKCVNPGPDNDVEVAVPSSLAIQKSHRVGTVLAWYHFFIPAALVPGLSLQGRKMFYHLALEHEILLHPQHFGPNIQVITGNQQPPTPPLLS